MRFYSTKLSIKVPLNVALIILGITAIFFSWYINREKKEILRQHFYHLKESANNLRSAINFIPDRNLNQGILDNFYEQVKKEEEEETKERKEALFFPGHEAHLVDLQGIIFASTHKELVGKRIDYALDMEEEGLFEVLRGRKKEAYEIMAHRGIKVTDYSLPLFQDKLNPTRITGALHYVEPYSKVEERIQEMILRYILFGLLLSGILFFLIYLLISRRVILPLGSLTEAMRKVEEKGLDSEIQISSRDEIGILAERFNHMIRFLKKAEEEKRERNQFIQRVTEGIEEGIMLLDRDFKILWANKKMQDSYGLEEGDIVGNFCYKVTHHLDEPCKPPYDICPVVEILKTGKPVTVTHTHFDKEGNKFYAEVSAYPLGHKEGKLNQFIYVTRDITERVKILKELESSRNELKEYAERLEDKVKERTKDLTESMRESDKRRQAIMNILEDVNEAREELARANKELKETQEQLIQAGKLSAIGELAGGVAHEINNPLTGVLNNVQLIKLEVESGKDFKLKDFQEFLDIIEESAQRCVRVTRALLDFSRKSRGEFESLDINDVIEGTFVLGSYELKLEEIEIVKELSPDLPFVLGNSNQLQQVLLNLISNAKNALRNIKGKKKLAVKTSALLDKKLVQIEFSDNGCGIPKENLDKIFEPFFTTMEVGKGTGLGLSISYGIIQAHKGNIEVKSIVGKGTTFTITLPAVEKK